MNTEEIEKAINNLKEYCREDKEFRENMAEDNYKSDFDIFCDKHINDIETVVGTLENIKESSQALIKEMKKDGSQYWARRWEKILEGK